MQRNEMGNSKIRQLNTSHNLLSKDTEKVKKKKSHLLVHLILVNIDS